MTKARSASGDARWAPCSAWRPGLAESTVTMGSCWSVVMAILFCGHCVLSSSDVFLSSPRCPLVEKSSRSSLALLTGAGTLRGTTCESV